MSGLGRLAAASAEMDTTPSLRMELGSMAWTSDLGQKTVRSDADSPEDEFFSVRIGSL